MSNSRRDLPRLDPSRKRSSSVLRTLHRIGGWLKRDEVDSALPDDSSHQDPQKQALNDYHLAPTQESGNNGSVQQDAMLAPSRSRGNSLLGRTLSKSKKVVPELSRQFTTKRQNSEKREKLLAVEPSATERRAVSAERRPRAMSPGRYHSPSPSRSAPDISTPGHMRLPFADTHAEGYFGTRALPLGDVQHDHFSQPPPPQNIPPVLEAVDEPTFLDDRDLQAELESTWILNLSMHFRDKSDREKFFVTYAQQPNRWCRVTVSCDYRDAPPSSLESDLKSLKFQRDKNQRIYEAIRESLPDIEFYDTVTNLKLETEDGQLHVHVTEDINEVITYPSVDFVEEGCRMYRESELDFQSHISGFVYKVRVGNQVLIKKEIPGPDTIDEFLYEIEVLNELRGSKGVIEFHGLVVDDEERTIKGLLISFASLGALVDVIYDDKLSSSLPWHRRQRWANQIVQGLSEIHEAGFVQGDFTLSNIVINSEDDAKIIDINRRGCPIGWEPPELLRLVRRGQKVSMFINVKSDIFQMGMVLWALAEQDDEPEHVTRTSSGGMPRITAQDVPNWFEDIIDACLSNQPRDRPSAKELLSMFPLHPREYESRRLAQGNSNHSLASHHSREEFNDPTSAVDWNAVEEFKRGQRKPTDFAPSYPTTDPYQFINAATSTEYRIDSTGSYVIPHRGKSPSGHRQRSAASSTTSLSLSQGLPACEYLCDEDIPGFGYTRDSQDRPTNLIPQRPSVPDAPPFRLDFNSAEEADNQYQRPGRRASNSDKGSPHPPRQQHVLFGPPVHQDSGFDEYMIDSIEHGQPSTHQSHHLPPLLTTTVETQNNSDQETSAPTQQSQLLTNPAALQSQPTPVTQFSYHTPSTFPSFSPDTRTQNLDAKSRNPTNQNNDK
ncbi:kinase-like protein, partial [Aureobasidium melanogenum]